MEIMKKNNNEFSIESENVRFPAFSEIYRLLRVYRVTFVARVGSGPPILMSGSDLEISRSVIVV